MRLLALGMLALLALAAGGATASASAHTLHLKGDAAAAATMYVGTAQSYWRASLKPGAKVNPSGCARVATRWGHLQLAGVTAEADVGGCDIRIDYGWWTQATGWERCITILHEWGHLLGFKHVGDHRSMMYGGDGPAWAPDVPVCGVAQWSAW